MVRRRVFKTRPFARWMRKTQLTDRVLCNAVNEMSCGLVDADLGGGVIKKRVALPGRGKSGSVRTLLATNLRDRWFFVFGFEKNEQTNVSPQELTALRVYAADLLRLTARQLEAGIVEDTFQEICRDDENQNQEPTA